MIVFLETANLSCSLTQVVKINVARSFQGEEHVGNITTSNKKETLLYFEADAWVYFGPFI